MRISLIIEVISLFNLISCTLTFTGGGISGKVKVLPVENESSAFGIEDILTPALVDAFVEDGRIKVDENGDYELSVVVLDYKREPASFETSGVVNEYRYVLKSKVTLIKLSDSTKVLDRNISRVITLSSEKDENEGIKEVVKGLGAEIIKLVLEQW